MEAGITRVGNAWFWCFGRKEIVRKLDYGMMDGGFVLKFNKFQIVVRVECF